uniref:Ornithine decarboxylase n=1 Tax=Panagrellus redivivus TaxID=6233 RepID=DCOR_PANRE|nr:RecName: Full=Ornithine decarboxylase; Short=ODC [Panagrellus redivivus]CAA57683.1 ornithine decarboxylase [Panagrellus redivivus]CAA65024.1 ornithine decarboxylase [Panagrellus redivivus]
MTLTGCVDYYEIIAGTKVAVCRNAIDNKTVATAIAATRTVNGNDDPFVVMNVSTIMAKVIQWQRTMPRVAPCYAVKCNDDKVLLRTLADLGMGFDCASKAEIEKVIGLVGPEKIVYANPCKTRGFIAHAEAAGVKRMTFDSVEELTKIKQNHADPSLILRISVSDPTAQCQLGIKFGCDPETVAPKLLRKAADMGMNVIGISFHVGSGCNEPATFRTALEYARGLFDLGISLGLSMTLLDIGGGFPGVDTAHISLDACAAVINPALEELFPLDSCPDVEVIAEPGRYFACAAVSVTTNVIASVKVPASRITEKADDVNRDGYMYYMNDGVYGSFNCKLFDHYQPRGMPLAEHDADEPRFPVCVWGPTCDGLDQVEESSVMPRLYEGDWLYYPDMGAYTSVAASTFNGFDKPKTYYFIDEATLGSIVRKADSAPRG